ncbi:unnamed protein product, partial [Mesorhabditis belari]|uniref:CB1 cannabinoid receptor-interacting protein 1 n=1 Tax=Mesorhabditis belari TaxID=2138241 RepID=A0AAF3FD11_9BILA
MPGPAGFHLDISIRNAENGDPIAFKVDGERFDGGTRTLKFASNARYKIQLTARPPHEFLSLHLAGSDLALLAEDPKSGQYVAEWNTTGIDATGKGSRHNINLHLQGPGGLLKKQLQTKFYNRDDSHAEWGHKLEKLIWKCSVDDRGNISVNDEEYK